MLTLSFSLKHPTHAKFIRQGSIATKRHFSQSVEQGWVCPFGKLIEYLLELGIGCIADVQTDGIALFCCSRGVKPVRCRHLDGTTGERRIDYFVLLARWILHFAWQVSGRGYSK